MPVSKVGSPSSRLAGLVAGDLPGYRREDADGRVRFVPDGDGPALDLAARIEKRFLGRTEIAVFSAELGVSYPHEATIELRHTGRMKRTGVTAAPTEGGDAVGRIAEALSSDPALEEALLPLDFTRFEVSLSPDGCRVQIELMGASHVAIALPPIRSYVHLHPDQREAMVRSIVELRRVVAAG